MPHADPPQNRGGGGGGDNGGGGGDRGSRRARRPRKRPGPSRKGGGAAAAAPPPGSTAARNPHSPPPFDAASSLDGGASPPPSPSPSSSSARSKLRRASELERELAETAAGRKERRRGKSGAGGAPPPGASEDARIAALQSELCECLSSVAISHPEEASSAGVAGRLWRGSIYGKIHDHRSRLRKAKEKSGGAAEDLERSLNQFLQECVKLYEYLIDMVAKLLLPLSQSQQSQASQQSLPSRTASAADEERRVAAVLTYLPQMLAHLGDLHRYSSRPNEASRRYLQCAALDPATGHPHNQLAVVAQGGGDRASAVYRYARALSARTPWEIGRANLSLLFSENRRWLKEHARGDGGEDGQGEDPQQPLGMSKKARREWMQKERSVLTRKFLAWFVDLQYDFCGGPGGGPAVKTAPLLESFSRLLANASFSESLLCRLVAILAFSTLRAGTGGSANPNENGADTTATNQKRAFSFLLRFCGELGRHARSRVSRQRRGGAGAWAADGGGSNHPAIRSFPALLLGCEFASSILDGSQERFRLPSSGLMGSGDDEADPRVADALATFWESAADLADEMDGVLPTSSPPSQPRVADLKRLEEFRGFVPFAPFLECADGGGKNKKPTTLRPSADEALEILSGPGAASASQTPPPLPSSQDSSKSSGGGGGGEDDFKLKAGLFLSFVDRHTLPAGGLPDAGLHYIVVADSSAGRRRHLRIGGSAAAVSSPAPDAGAAAAAGSGPARVERPRVAATGGGALSPADEIRGGGGEALVYRRPVPGSGGGSDIPLLVPGALLLGGVSGASAGVGATAAPLPNGFASAAAGAAPIGAVAGPGGGGMPGIAGANFRSPTPGGIGGTAAPAAVGPPASVRPPPGFGFGGVPPALSAAGLASPGPLLSRGVAADPFQALFPAQLPTVAPPPAPPPVAPWWQAHRAPQAGPVGPAAGAFGSGIAAPRFAVVPTGNPFARAAQPMPTPPAGFPAAAGADPRALLNGMGGVGLDPALRFLLDGGGGIGVGGGFRSPDEVASSLSPDDLLLRGLLVPPVASEERSMREDSLLKFLFEPVAADPEGPQLQREQLSAAAYRQQHPRTNNPFVA